MDDVSPMVVRVMRVIMNDGNIYDDDEDDDDEDEDGDEDDYDDDDSLIDYQ